MTHARLHPDRQPRPLPRLRAPARGAGGAAGRPVPIPFGQVECNNCGGTGMIKLTEREIIARTVKEAIRLHWPAFDERNGL